MYAVFEYGKADPGASLQEILQVGLTLEDLSCSDSPRRRKGKNIVGNSTVKTIDATRPLLRAEEG